MNKGSTPVFALRHDYTVNVTTAAWVELHASLPESANRLEIFDSSGQTLKLGIGPSGSETDLNVQIMPGGNSPFEVRVPLNKGMRLVVRAVSATAVAPAELNINAYA